MNSFCTYLGAVRSTVRVQPEPGAGQRQEARGHLRRHPCPAGQVPEHVKKLSLPNYQMVTYLVTKSVVTNLPVTKLSLLLCYQIVTII